MEKKKIRRWLIKKKRKNWRDKKIKIKKEWIIKKGLNKLIKIIWMIMVIKVIINCKLRMKEMKNEKMNMKERW
jgi:hypothetical protein